MTVPLSKPSLPSKPKADLPCILCLHGGGTSALIFKIQTRRLQRLLANRFRFVFVDAPFEGEAGPGVLPYFEGMGPFYRWINSDGDDEAKVRPLLEKTMADDGGNFVGVLGFSQGARLALGLLHEKQQRRVGAFNNFGFGIFLCGTYPPLGLASALFPVTPVAKFKDQQWDSRHEAVLNIPSIHVLGARDPFLIKSRLLVQCSEPSSRTVYKFDIGHHLPVMPADNQLLADSIIKLHEDYQRQLQDDIMKQLEKTLEEVEVTELSYPI
ncbi:MAG: hypothetical protein LQ351_001337 [Letrouitia transgressa]|nr:MAG: hypothetical protein LQ351_001337 [Letrouitia transgressa]